ncbi:MAG: DUF2666 family protein [Candidatus Diapherotrites archaeon]|nr:DUF2666 family protein [Candidatus Diapherotrites archaeon]
MEKTIQFVANYDDWKAVKKIAVNEKTDPKTVMEFLAGLSMSFDNKIGENLAKVVELQKLDAAINEMSFGKTEAEVANVLREINTRKIGAVINEICEKPELQKNEQKELKGFCRVYATKKALLKCDFNIDYSGVEIPGMKRLKKVKI